MICSARETEIARRGSGRIHRASSGVPGIMNSLLTMSRDDVRAQIEVLNLPLGLPAFSPPAARFSCNLKSMKSEALDYSIERDVATRQPVIQPIAAAFLALFCIVGLALWGLPFYYDFMVQQFGWTRAQVTSGNALSKLVVGPAFGFIAGWMVDRFGPRRLMMLGILLAGTALIGLGNISTLGMFYFFYVLNALGYVCGGPLPNQVLLSRTFDKSRGKAMGIAYLGIGIGGAIVPWISHALVKQYGWQTALQIV